MVINNLLLIGLAVSFVSLLSLSGVLTLLLNQSYLHKIISCLVSFAVGTLLGSVWWHLLPDSYAHLPASLVGFLVLLGLFIFLVLEKLIRHHHCHELDCQQKPTGWLVLISDTLHNFMDGLIIASAFLINPSLGFSTTLAVAGHEIAQEIGDFSILLHSGFTPYKALGFNFLSALSALLGAGLALFINSTTWQSYLIYIPPLTAGGFLYIALVDLIPELHQHTSYPRTSFFQILFLFLGLIVVFMLK